VASSHVTVGSGDHHVLALHGWFGSARGWGSLPDYLDGAAYTYVFMDLRGYGGRRQVAGDFTMEEAAADGLALADELGWDRFSVIGHSMSGQAIQHLLLQAPGRVRRLVALNPVPATGVPFDADGWALFSGAAASRDNRAAIINFSTGGRLPAVFIEHVVQHSLGNSTTEAFGGYLESWAKTDFSDQVKGNRAAVKVIVGEHDPALPAPVMEQTWMAFYPAAELEVIPNSGHYPMYETPAALAASIEEFLGRE
jgi:pimeloyl-ACP methyl ester carboxylesterase